MTCDSQHTAALGLAHDFRSLCLQLRHGHCGIHNDFTYYTEMAGLQAPRSGPNLRQDSGSMEAVQQVLRIAISFHFEKSRCAFLANVSFQTAFFPNQFGLEISPTAKTSGELLKIFFQSEIMRQFGNISDTIAPNAQ